MIAPAAPPPRHAARFTAVAFAVVTVGALAAARCQEAPRSPVPTGPATFARTFDVHAFAKGNLHTHTTRSDGDSSPEAVISWYREHGYDFLALTDHNLRSDPSEFAALEDDRFRLIAGEEVTMTGGGRQVHVNALCTKDTIGGGDFPTAIDALRRAESAIDAQGGVALVNHPNFDLGLAPEDLLAVHGPALLEIRSGHPYVFSEGVVGRPSHEALWDWSLEHGARFAGVAVDDMHRLSEEGEPPAYPGRGWVQVFTDAHDATAICDTLRRGALYASTGAELARIRVTATTYEVWPRGGALVVFIDRHGAERARVATTDDGGASGAAIYELHGDESYVRARVLTPDGAAWTPAVHVTR